MKKYTIQQIEEKLLTIKEVNDPFITSLSNDSRKGVVKLLEKWKNQAEQKERLHKLFLSMTVYEQQCYNEGFHYVTGIDEVGRGPLAGPVIAASVILPKHFYLPGINDSKKLSESKREEYFEIINNEAIGIGVGIVSAEEIDEINIYEATKKAMLSSITQLNVQPDFLLIDAMKLETPFPLYSIIKGDSKSVSIAAASIIAKVTRDRLMKKIGEKYPNYGFEKNMGYGTNEHLKAIEKYGITPYHRKSFSPIKNYSF